MKSLRSHALRIFRAALKAADPAEAVLRSVRMQGDWLVVEKQRYRLSQIKNIYVLGAGKASAAMAVPIERLLGARITAGYLNVKDGHTAKLRRIHLNECSHPVPDERGLRGSQEIARIAAGAQAGDLVICLISGGASALLPFPAPPITLQEKQRTTQLLLDSGADIQEMNIVRKHISSLKGGRLAALSCPATVISLLLSDVIGDRLDVIGSGPTVPDLSSYGDAKGVLEKYRLWRKVPASVVERIKQGIYGQVPETPKPGSLPFSKTRNIVVGSNQLALRAAAVEAKKLGYRPMILSSYVEGETKEVARVHAAIAKEIRFQSRPIPSPACVISGGETTVTIRGNGKGGRNQEFALAAAIDIAGLDETLILSAGTDGTDGPTDAAGAIADGSTLHRARKKSLDPARFLLNNDSYNFFEPLGDLLRTGPTGTNVMDVRLILVA